MNLYQKLLKIQEELGVVAKNLEVETGKGKGYKAVSERDIIDAVKPLEVKYGIYSFPVKRVILESEMLENETQYGKKTNFFSRIETTYRFVNAEEPAEFIETTVFSEGIDSQDKGSGKAMTYGDKYALMKMYKISTGDDPDMKASEEIVYQKIEYVDTAKKKAFMSMCEAKGLNYEDILMEVGWKKGEKLTNQQYGKALNKLNERAN